jgi:lipopolysaccharide/colanic/teichoic acid biosynthesis glycosyltransferase
MRCRDASTSHYEYNNICQRVLIIAVVSVIVILLSMAMTIFNLVITVQGRRSQPPTSFGNQAAYFTTTPHARQGQFN